MFQPLHPSFSASLCAVSLLCALGLGCTGTTSESTDTRLEDMSTTQTSSTNVTNTMMVDMAMPAKDMRATEQDMATSVQDMFVAPVDMSNPPADMSSAMDQATAPDLAMMPDMAPQADMYMPPDMYVPPGVGPTPRTKARVMFSGHSLTDASVPTVRRLAQEQSLDFVSLYQSIPGSPMAARTKGGRETPPTWSGYSSGTPNGLNLVSEFRNPTQLPGNDRYDTVVITERHDLLGTVQWESTVSLLRHYHDRLRESTATGVTYFYHSWLSIDKSNPQPWIDYEKDALIAWECVSSKVNHTLQADGHPQNVKTVGTGWALAHMVEEALAGRIPGLSGSQQSILDQIFSDNVHMTPLGSLFTGAYTYGAVMGQDPTQTQIPQGIAQNTGRALLTLAWDLVKRYHARPSKGVHTMSDCRTHISTKVCGPFWTYFFNGAGNVPGCQSYFGTAGGDNPFVWPDPNLTVWPVP